MKFFTAGDVLQSSSVAAPTDPVTIDLDNTVYQALDRMFTHNFSQLPVMNGGTVSGVVTYKSICQMLKAVPEPGIPQLTVKGALVQPRYVDEDEDVFNLLETFAEDEYVLVGHAENLTGILTRYDVFHFLRRQFEPFIKIGGIERSLRTLFTESIPNLDERIQETFGPRADDDASYSVPDSVEHFNFEEYKRFIVVNFDHLPSHIENDRDFILELLEKVRKTRNSLFHFRSSVDEIDREAIDVAHSYFTGLAE